MKEFGGTLRGFNVLSAIIAGVVASVVIGVPMMQAGMLDAMVARLIGSDSLAVGWAIHLLAGASFGAAYGLLVSTRSLVRGFAYGVAYGLIVGIAFAWLTVFAILGEPITPTSAAGWTDVGLHTIWGGILGVGQALAIGLAHVRPPELPMAKA